ncbi:hypothetical protein FI667_g14295, partial [Globisporangium splendens]
MGSCVNDEHHSIGNQSHKAAKSSENMAMLSDKEVLAVLHYREVGLSFAKIARHVQWSEEAVRRVLRDIDTPRIQRLLFARDGNGRHEDDTQDDDTAARLTSEQQQLKTHVKKAKSEPELSEYEAKRLQRMRENQATLIALGVEKLVVKQKREKRELTREEEEVRKNPRRSKRKAIADGTASGEFEFVELVEFRRKPDPTKPEGRKARVEEVQAPTPQNALFYVDAESFRPSRWLGNENELLAATQEPSTLISTNDSSPAKKEETDMEPTQTHWNGVVRNMQSLKSNGGEDGGAVCFRWVAARVTTLLPGSDFVNRLRRTAKGHKNLRIDDETYYNSKTSASLQEAEKGAAASKQSDPVLFFLRDANGAYIYCGRLGYLGYRPGSNPLEFRWQLLDHAAVDWEKIQTPA